MEQFLPDPLSADEFTALRLIAIGANQGIAVHIQNRLKLSGYVTEIAKGLVVTIEGQMTLAVRK